MCRCARLQYIYICGGNIGGPGGGGGKGRRRGGGEEAGGGVGAGGEEDESRTRSKGTSIVSTADPTEYSVRRNQVLLNILPSMKA